MQFDELSRKVIGCAIEVHRGLGPGLLESVYRRCLEHELSSAGLRFESEKRVNVRYKNLAMECDLRLDILVEEALIIETKSVELLSTLHEAQLLTYLKLSGCKVGLLINFNVRSLRDGLKRVVL